MARLLTLPNSAVPIGGQVEMTREWFQALDAIVKRLNGPVQAPEYASANKPAASAYLNALIVITGSGLARSDGVNWRAVDGGAIIP